MQLGRREYGFQPVGRMEGRFGGGGLSCTQISEQSVERAVTTVVAGTTPALKVDTLLLGFAAVLEEKVGRWQPKVPRDVGERENEDSGSSCHVVHMLSTGHA